MLRMFMKAQFVYIEFKRKMMMLMFCKFCNFIDFLKKILFNLK